MADNMDFTLKITDEMKQDSDDHELGGLIRKFFEIDPYGSINFWPADEEASAKECQTKIVFSCCLGDYEETEMWGETHLDCMRKIVNGLSGEWQ